MSEAYTVEQIRKAFRKYAGKDDWGVPSFYEGGLIAALRGEYDEPAAERVVDNEYECGCQTGRFVPDGPAFAEVCSSHGGSGVPVGPEKPE